MHKDLAEVVRAGCISTLEVGVRVVPFGVDFIWRLPYDIDVVGMEKIESFELIAEAVSKPHVSHQV